MIFLQPTAKSAIKRAEMPSGYFGIRIKVQRAGRKAMMAREFLNGRKVKIGSLINEKK